MGQLLPAHRQHRVTPEFKCIAIIGIIGTIYKCGGSRDHMAEQADWRVEP